jgi:GNAT superfamily N-acetyltransferase
MSQVAIEVSCPVHDSFRVRQIGGMFDVPPAVRATERFAVDVPDGLAAADDWRVGLIVGPSGSGKTTIARKLFGHLVELDRRREWPMDAAVIDGFGPLPTKDIARLLCAVGFSSPPSWLKPYQVLSNGEQFRCDLARALAEACESGKRKAESGADEPPPLVVFDEFTSVVDRQVARVVSAAVAKGVRAGQIPCRFAAVTCHYDVTEWLAPDWVLDMASAEFSRRRLRRPEIQLEVFRCRRCAWRLFARHHYLSGELSRYARCFLALWEGRPAAFCATLSLVGKKDRWRISRVVTLPDYQGVGIGTALAEAVAELHRAEGHRVNMTCSHPAMIAHCRRSLRWRTVGVKRISGRKKQLYANYRDAAGRAVVSFEYMG